MKKSYWLAALALAVLLPGLPDLSVLPDLFAAQIPFEQAAADLASPDAAVRLRAVQLLKQAAFPEAAIPLAPLVGDARDDIQLEAIAAELNIFLAAPAASKKGLRMGAEPAFSAGSSALGLRPVPIEVVNALRKAARDENPRVAVDALYVFGLLASEQKGSARHDLLNAAGPDLAAFVGASLPVLRLAGVRVLGRLFEKRATDPPIEPTVGDAVITALNDADRAVKLAAMQALGSMRYERGVQALTELFTYYGKGEPAEASLDALAHIGHPTSVPLFIAQLTSKTPAIRGIAMEGLARSHDVSALAALQAAVDHESNQDAALAGAFALVMLGNAPTDKVSDSLGPARTRDQARQYLIELAPGRTATFAHQLLDSDPEIRVMMVEILGLAGDPAAIAVLEPLTHDRVPEVALAAELAVARLSRH